jgi:AcrR family transcriptional regulator
MSKLDQNPSGDKKQYLFDGVKGRIVYEAVHLFLEKGYNGTSVREIVASSGVTKPVLYYYFPSKEGLYREIVLELISDFDRSIKTIVSNTELEFRQKLHEIFNMVLSKNTKESTLMLFIYAMRLTPLFMEILKEHAENLEHLILIQALFQEAQENCEIRSDIPPRTLAVFFLGLIWESIDDQIFLPQELREPGKEEAVMKILFDGINLPKNQRESTSK